MIKKGMRRKKLKIESKYKKTLIFSFLAVIAIFSIIALSYSDLNSLKNNSVATDLSFDDHPAIVNHLTETAKQVEGKGARDFNMFYDGTYNGVDWCAMFIWWLFNQDGRAKNFIVKNSFAGNMARDSVKAGLGDWYEDECTDPKTVPKAGDLILYDPWIGGKTVPWPANGEDRYYSSHIGYVYKVTDSDVYSIEGNVNSGYYLGAWKSNPGNGVWEQKHSRKYCGSGNSQGINGYYRPKYGPHYTVKFMPNGSNVKGSMSIQYFKQGETRSLLPVGFTRDNYRFMGWVAQRDNGLKYCYTSPSRTATWTNPRNCYGDYIFSNQQVLTNSYGNDGVLYMYAQWRKISYDTPKTPEPSKPQQSSSSSSVTPKPNPIQTPKYFTVKYYHNGGTGSMSDQQIVYGSTTNNSLKQNWFSRSDYKFIGWHAQREDGKWYCFTNSSKTKAAWLKISSCNYGFYLYRNQQSVPTIVKAGSYVSMTAQWHPTTFIVKFRGNGATKGSMTDQKMTYGAKNILNSNNYSRSGYAFGGWVAQRWDGKVYCYTSPSKTKAGWLSMSQCDNYYYFKNNQQLTTTVPGGKTVTMFVHWKINKFHVAFYPGASGVKKSMNNQIINYGELTNLNPNRFERRGYQFRGWNAQREDGKWYCYASPAKSKAGWYRIDACYDFYEYKDRQVVSTTVAPGSYVKMVAQWRSTKFTVRFDANGGHGFMYPRYIIYGEPTKLYGNAYKREGYRFFGWVAQRNDNNKVYCYTSPSKTKAAWKKLGDCIFGYYYYKDKQKVSKTTPPNTIVTFFAQWKKK